MADKPMIVTKPPSSVLDPRSALKFEKDGQSGRVLNMRAETDGTGTVIVQMVHPDGSVEDLASVLIPLLAKGERCVVQARVATGIIPAEKAEVAEIG